MVQGKVAHEKSYVLEQERMRRRGSPRVFARTEEEEERKTRHVGNGQVEGGTGENSKLHGVTENRNRNRFYTIGRVVGAGIAGEHPLEAKIDSTLWRESRVRGPHTRERLANAS